ncbi:MAG: ExbD/TolR family protein [Gammaproteobacteria bacterium]|jgi:biopolymer transport protein ExbD|nr:biopolymer transporter ExbD [Pseudomonadota bacterium]NCX10351.1 biopolymer transporter ExbD [Pseudomonadota bacterium]NCX24834.1 biopolymer transporter ExbD [Pseudomonadota bacterium]NCX33838.1 biopolymer transporter ExbD [Pseudomonadota bacterium]|tara:strand:- start:210 stop:617 length:408 start_codon:yes stop_codon:yes gene_type:complete
MKFLNQQKSSFSIEITPLIDIVFLLVIFFVVTSKVGDSQFLSLDLPKTESFEYNIVESTNNEISILADGSVYINGKALNISNIKEIEQVIFELDNTDNSIILSAEASSLHIWIVGIMDILNKYGFNEVQIRTIEK